MSLLPEEVFAGRMRAARIRKDRKPDWSDDRVEHIAGHGVTAEEVEQVCFGRALVLRAKSQGRSPVYYCLGQTQTGRYLFCVVIAFPDGNGYPVTARPMTDKEKRRFQRWRNR